MLFDLERRSRQHRACVLKRCYASSVPPSPHTLAPFALVGLGLLFAMGSSGGSATPIDEHRLLTGPRLARVHALFGSPASPFVVPFDISMNDVIGMFREYREEEPFSEWKGHTYLILKRGPLAPEKFWIREDLEQVVRLIGDESSFLKVHLPVGVTRPRSQEEWSRAHHGDEPSMEVARVLLNRDNIVSIGPSPLGHYLKRKLGKVITRDGSEFHLYEGLDSLRILVGPNVLEQ